MKNTTVLTIVKQQSIYRSILFGSFCLYWLLVTFCCRLILSTLFCQGCVRGQHGRGQGQGQGQGSSRPRPRPRPQNFVLEVEASPRGPPSLGFFSARATQRAVMPSHLSVHHSQIQRPTAASCALVYEL